jgi:hypothetical protein
MHPSKMVAICVSQIAIFGDFHLKKSYDVTRSEVFVAQCVKDP